MKILKNKISLVILVGVFAFGLTGLVIKAATTVNLGTADDFAVLAGAGITNTGASTIVGDIGSSPIHTETGLVPCPAADCVTLTGTNHNDADPNDAITQGAKTDLITAYDNAAGQTPVLVPAELGGHTFTPGVYKNNGDLDSLAITGTVTLDAQGDANAVFIFQSGSTLITANNSVVVLKNSAQACNVFWQVTSSATLGTNSTFKGNILALTSATLNNGANVEGRVLARNGAVTLNTNTITVPATCVVSTPVPVSSTSRWGTINVVKRVINDNGGTKTIVDFPLFVNGTSVVSGITNNFPAPADAYTVTETVNSNYTQTFSGDCPDNGRVSINPGENKFCIITNDDIGMPVVVPPVPPLIDLVKVPSPLALPAGPGSVNYTYTLRNIGTVPVTDITMVGDTCSPIILASGDVNGDSKLDLNETWIYRCSTTLSETHTNTVVATGWANGITATDIANATVVVGASAAPPLIHITKVPNPLTLSAGGGMVSYTKKITNPGTVALSNVRVADDKCSPVNYISGDTNGDAKLDPAETWTYTCRTNLTKTTTNTATAIGEANGLIARDLAIVTVIVAAPGLPNTGFSPFANPLVIILAGLLVLVLILVVIFVFLKKRKI